MSTLVSFLGLKRPYLQSSCGGPLLRLDDDGRLRPAEPDQVEAWREALALRRDEDAGRSAAWSLARDWGERADDPRTLALLDRERATLTRVESRAEDRKARVSELRSILERDGSVVAERLPRPVETGVDSEMSVVGIDVGARALKDAGPVEGLSILARLSGDRQNGPDADKFGLQHSDPGAERLDTDGLGHEAFSCGLQPGDEAESAGRGNRPADEAREAAQ